jgi:hypothetical protein
VSWSTLEKQFGKVAKTGHIPKKKFPKSHHDVHSLLSVLATYGSYYEQSVSTHSVTVFTSHLSLLMQARFKKSVVVNTKFT